ncbi:MAG TPA: TetR family transcriptional regulator C-terminal domain-containing protein [Amycolatopsis sp.]|nr:TetR family transcriptional regulator C-terminal domain-containing protein [Amycolatopsis sp.]
MARTDLIADSAIEVIAREGMRGLTHRAVDREAGLAPGSTSYYARTRLALLELAVTRMADLDEAAAPPRDARPLPDVLAGFLHTMLTEAPARTRARFEFALEASRRPELRAVYDRVGRRFRDACTALLADAGSPAPGRHARMLITWCDGVLFDSLAGTGAASPPDRAELTAGAADLLAAILPR